MTRPRATGAPDSERRREIPDRTRGDGGVGSAGGGVAACDGASFEGVRVTEGLRERNMATGKGEGRREGRKEGDGRMDVVGGGKCAVVQVACGVL